MLSKPFSIELYLIKPHGDSKFNVQNVALHQWCQDPFFTPKKGIFEPTACPLLDGVPAQYCRKVDQTGKRMIKHMYPSIKFKL